MAATSSAASSSASADAARSKNRIIAHMNKDHKHELSHYLRHYARLSHSAASSPTMRDIDLDGMLIAANDKSHTVPFVPPLASWADVKGRVIDMATEARQGLGISDVTITEYVPPEGFDMVVFGAVLFYYLCALTLPLVVPGTPAWSLLSTVFPGGPERFRWVVKVIFLPVVGIHLIECYLFVNTLDKHNVEQFSWVWWAWQLSCFIEGFPAFKRVRRVAERMRAAREAKDAKKQ